MRRLPFMTHAATAAIASLAASPVTASARSASPAAAEAAVRTFVRALTTHDLTLLDTCIATDYVQHHDGIPPGRAGVVDYFRETIAAVPDFHVTLEDFLTDGTRIVARITYAGTGPKGAFTEHAIDWWRVTDGKLAEHWDAS